MRRINEKRTKKSNIQVASNKQIVQQGCQQQKQNCSISAQEIIFTSLKKQNHVLASHSEQQIMMLLAYIESGSQVKIIPIVPTNKQKKLIQVYQIRDKTLVPHRVMKKRTNKNPQQIKNQYPKLGCVLLFIVEANLLFNCIMLQIQKCSKLNISIGLNKQQVTGIKMQEDENNIQELLKLQQISIKMYEDVQKYLSLKKEQNKQIIISNQEGKRIKKQNKFTLSQLKQVILDVNNYILNIEQWAFSLQIMSYISQYIEYKANNIQKLYLNTFQFQNYRLQGRSLIIEKQYNKINTLIKRILLKRNTNISYPYLTDISFNPMFVLNEPQQQQNIQKYENNQQQQKQKYLPFINLHFVSISQQINEKDNISKLINYIMPNFPKISHLYINMTPQTLFKKFNQLCSQLYKYSPLIQSLYIFDNDPMINKQEGLKDIIINYPYLSDLKIKLWPRKNQQNIVNQQYTKQWGYIKQIQFRRIHIQRLLNTLKILQKQGYDKYQCMGIMQFIKPLKFASLLT